MLPALWEVGSGNDLSSVPQCGLFSIAPRRSSRFSWNHCWLEALAVPYLRLPLLCLARGSFLCRICPLPPLWEFRSRAHFPGTSRAGDSDFPAAAPWLSGVSM